jgi:hypothetical protein
MRRVRMTVQYDGTAYHGWQEQRRPEGGAVGAGVRTVQGALVAAPARILDARPKVGATRNCRLSVRACRTLCAWTVRPVCYLTRDCTGLRRNGLRARTGDLVGWRVAETLADRGYAVRLETRRLPCLAPFHEILAACRVRGKRFVLELASLCKVKIPEGVGQKVVARHNSEDRTR